MYGDLYELQRDAQNKICYTCRHESNCKVRTLELDGFCNYQIKSDVNKLIRKIERLS